MASQHRRGSDVDPLGVALEGSANGPRARSLSQRPLWCTAVDLRLSPSTNLRGLALRAYDVCVSRGEEPRMRKVTAVLMLTLASVVLSAGAAMADSNYPPTVVKGASGSKGDGATAFTGASQLP